MAKKIRHLDDIETKGEMKFNDPEYDRFSIKPWCRIYVYDKYGRKLSSYKLLKKHSDCGKLEVITTHISSRLICLCGEVRYPILQVKLNFNDPNVLDDGDFVFGKREIDPELKDEYAARGIPLKE